MWEVRVGKIGSGKRTLQPEGTQEGYLKSPWFTRDFFHQSPKESEVPIDTSLVKLNEFVLLQNTNLGQRIDVVKGDLLQPVIPA